MRSAPNINPNGPPSPRFSLARDEFPAIQEALDKVGHVVLENCFSSCDIDELREYGKALFDDYDNEWRAGNIPKKNLNTYYQSSRTIGALNDQLFIEMVYRSRLRKLMVFLYGGSATMFLDDRVVRRMHPQHPMRIVAYHTDFQILPFSENSYTTWMPLTELGPDTYNLALFDVNSPAAEMVEELGIKINDIVECDDTPEVTAARAADFKARHDKLFETHLDHIYLPMLEVGDVLMFSRYTMHGTHVNSNATRERLSVDFRWCEKFDWHANEAFSGRWAVLFDGDEGDRLTFSTKSAELEYFRNANESRAIIANLTKEIQESAVYVKLSEETKELYQRMENCIALPPAVAKNAQRISRIKKWLLSKITSGVTLNR